MKKIYLVIFTWKGGDFVITDTSGSPIVMILYKSVETLVTEFGDAINMYGGYNKNFTVEWAATQLIDFDLRIVECVGISKPLFGYLSTSKVHVDIAGIPTQGVRVLDNSLFDGSTQKTFEDIGLETIAAM